MEEIIAVAHGDYMELPAEDREKLQIANPPCE